MRYFALAMDFDGTLACHGSVDAPTLDALARLRASGRKLILVTGRQLDDLKKSFPHLDLFDRVVAENGALLYRPLGRTEKILATPPPPAFAQALVARGVDPVSTGRVIVATWHPHEVTVLEVIRDLGLESHVIFNKGAVMVLPSGVNKKTGLVAALRELGLSFHDTVGIGDAENDHAFLEASELSVAVQNALPALKAEVDWVTPGKRSDGVRDLAEGLLTDDLAEISARTTRHGLVIGTFDDGTDFILPPFGMIVLIAGISGGGKSSATHALLEKLADAGYQYCLIDPEGDHERVEGAVTLDSSDRPARMEEVIDVLKNTDSNAVVNLLALPLEDRPSFFAGLLTTLQAMRARTGHPHWIVIDEAHHMLPPEYQPSHLAVAEAVSELLLVTVHPSRVAKSLLMRVGIVLAIGAEAHLTIGEYAEAVATPPPELPERSPKPGEALAWVRNTSVAKIVKLVRGKRDHLRHRRKYAEGDLAPELSFYFHGPKHKLKLRAQNLHVFTQLAYGVDDATWLFHLRAHDYSRWFREGIKDPTLAAAAERVESARRISAAESRAVICEAIERRYTRSA